MKGAKMIYLYETMQLSNATPVHLEQWIQFAREHLLPWYTKHGGRIMAAWICNAETLFQITQLVEFNDQVKAMAFLANSAEDDVTINCNVTMNNIAPLRERQIFTSPSPAFSESLHRAILECSQEENSKFSIAQLETVYDQLAGLIQRNEGAIAAGMPLVTTLVSATGGQNRVINIWKTDFNEPGYQPPEFYEAIGFGEDWWTWIRSVAPQERLWTVSMLPYSPLQ